MNEYVNDDFNEKKKNSLTPYVVGILLALILVTVIISTSYAYFSATVSGTGNNTVVTTTSLEIEFTDGAAVSLQNALPGQYIEKTFKVENKGNGDTTYDVYMSELINDFEDKTDLVYTLTSNDGGYNVSTNTQVPSSSSKIVNSQLLRAGEAHNYTLRISFLETNDNQDDNKGKQFSTIIRVNEVQAPTKQVTLHPNEGTLDNATISLPIGEVITNLPVPARSGYKLEGWYLDSGLTQKVTSETVMTTSINDLYAKYIESVCNLSSGNCDLSTIGSEVKIANEEFYVIGQEDSSHVKLLSKWNLNVGNNIQPGEQGIQNSLAIGWNSDYSTKVNGFYPGAVAFSSTRYWHDSANNKAKDEYGGYTFNTNTSPYSYNDGQGNVVYPYVYDSNSNIKQYVDTYVTYLNTQGVQVSGRLIKQEELVSLGCNASINHCASSDGGTAPSWVYQTSYWSGSAYDRNNVWFVHSKGYFHHDLYDFNYNMGVRPVIILEK